MDNELEVIRTEMEHTRSSLADKIEALESEFRGTVEGATNAVSNTVETVQEAVASVKEGVKETVETVKDTFDVRKHVERHPWAMFGGAMLVGCFAGFMVGRRKTRSAKAAEVIEPVKEPVVRNGSGHRNGAARKASAEEEGPLQSSLKMIKGLALGTMMGVLRDVLVGAVPTTVASDLAGVVDDMTTRLGGKPLRGPILTNEQDPEQEEEPHHVESDPAEMGRPMGATRWSR